MALRSLQMHGANLSTLGQWAHAELQPSARQDRGQRQHVVQQRLSELLFGLELNLEEMAQYRNRLLQALVCVDEITADSSLPNPSSARIAPTQQILKMGSLGWRPFPITERLIDVSPTQRLLERSLARAVKIQHALDPKSKSYSFHSIGIIVAQGSEGLRVGEDRVELSSWGYEVMEAKDYPQIVRLRLPPRYPTKTDIIKLYAS